MLKKYFADSQGMVEFARPPGPVRNIPTSIAENRLMVLPPLPSTPTNNNIDNAGLIVAAWKSTKKNNSATESARQSGSPTQKNGQNSCW